METRLNVNVASHSKLKEFFVEQLQDIYWAEKKMVKALPKLQEAATSSELRQAFSDHLLQTENHVIRLREVFGLIDEPVTAQKCPAMSGIVDEGEDIIDETDQLKEM
jgi:ferritin-like metal-binding protein YciE